MVRIRGLLRWAGALEATITWDQRLGRWSNIATVVSVAVALLVWIFGWILDIPWWVGVLAGLVAWVVILNGLVALGRRATPIPEPTAAPAKPGVKSSPASLPTDPAQTENLKVEIRLLKAEKESLEGQLRDTEQEHNSLKAINEEQQEQLERWNGDRLRFKGLVLELYSEGTELRGSEPGENEARKWADRARNLLEAALGDYWADRVLRDDPNFRTSRFGSYTEQQWMESRLNRVHDHVLRWVDSNRPIPFRSGFDPYEWDDWKTLPNGVSATSADLRELERLKGENERLATEIQELRQYEKRYFLRIVLKEAHEEGVKIRHGSFGKDEVGHWGIHVRAVLDEALGGFYPELLNRSVWQRIYATSTAEKYHVSDADLVAAFDKILKYVEGFAREIDSTDCPTINPDFDGKKWLDRQREWFRSDL